MIRGQLGFFVVRRDISLRACDYIMEHSDIDADATPNYAP
jgi:hypothetical protein